MAKSSFVGMDITKMQSLYEGLKKHVDIQVGVFSGGARHNGNARNEKVGFFDEGLTNAELAAYHELGAPKHGLPARSMLKIPIHDHAQTIMAPFKDKAEAFLKQGTLLQMYKLIGIAAEGVVTHAFDTGGYGKWVPLKDETIWRKLYRKGRSTAVRLGKFAQIQAGDVGMGILIRTAQLKRSFSSRIKMEF